MRTRYSPADILARLAYVVLVIFSMLFLQQPKPLVSQRKLCETAEVLHAMPSGSLMAGRARISLMAGCVRISL